MCSCTITSIRLASASARAVKENGQESSIEDCAEISQRVDVKTHNRMDAAGHRIWLVGQSVLQHISHQTLKCAVVVTCLYFCCPTIV